MTPIALSPNKVDMACCSLHNYLRGQRSSQSVYTLQGIIDGEDPDTHAIVPATGKVRVTHKDYAQYQDKAATCIQEQQRRCENTCVNTSCHQTVKCHGNTT